MRNSSPSSANAGENPPLCLCLAIASAEQKPTPGSGQPALRSTPLDKPFVPKDAQLVLNRRAQLSRWEMIWEAQLRASVVVKRTQAQRDHENGSKLQAARHRSDHADIMTLPIAAAA